MKSISYKILKMTLYCLTVLVVLMSAISVYVVTNITNKDSQDLLINVCEKETNRFNNEFQLLEHSALSIVEYMHELETEGESLDYLLSSEFCDKVQTMSLGIANRTGGAMAVYFRYNPELIGNGTQGFFWSRNSNLERFGYVQPTDILQYDQHDAEHVAWFYGPKNKRQAMWLLPYDNKNIKTYMISYVIPYYTKTGKFLGVVGMDIDFQKIVSLTDQVNFYQSGKAKLIDLSSYWVYRINEHGNIDNESMTNSLYNSITTLDGDERIKLLQDNDGTEIMASVGRLRNGMRLLLTVPVSEVNKQRNKLLYMFAVIMLAAFAVTALYIITTTKKMVYPLKILTRITSKYAHGDWSETYISKSEDEIQSLSESISVMAETTKSYIEKIHARAITDALTGLKNKNCYLAYVEKFQEQHPATAAYAVMVLDINYLKKMNDSYGHERGDELIKRAAQYICEVFEHSPVFRIGGDEFNVILENSDYVRREELCAKFVQGLKKMPMVADGISLSISYGIASFPADGSSYEEVFKCADKRMYAYKQKMKVGRE